MAAQRADQRAAMRALGAAMSEPLGSRAMEMRRGPLALESGQASTPGIVVRGTWEGTRKNRAAARGGDHGPARTARVSVWVWGARVDVCGVRVVRSESDDVRARQGPGAESWSCGSPHRVAV